MVSIVGLLVFAYIWGDIKVAAFIAVGFCLAKMLLAKK